jgi:uncharacterized protein (TIGR02145 family)
MKGSFYIAIMTIAGLIACEKENTSPKAGFTVNPATGNDETLFTFDASSSSDLEDPVDELMFRWDWEGDDVFDTQYASRKTADHIFQEPGEYLVTLVVKDSRGLTDTLQKNLMVESSNEPPGIPSKPNPGDGSAELGVNIIFSWECLDPDGDMLIYSIDFGTVDPPPAYLTNHTQNSFDPGKLEYGTKYFWKVYARDIEGNRSEGPVWELSTIDLNFSTMTDNRDNKTYQTIEIGTQWWMAENLNYEMDGSFCYSDNIGNCFNYGSLYTWEAAMEACPEGWHLPTREEIELMVDFLGGPDVAGGKLKDYESRKWQSPNTGAVNTSGFGALPAGMRYGEGNYSGQKYYSHFFSSTEFDEDDAYVLLLSYDYEKSIVYNYKKRYSVSVRCIRD